MSGRRWGGAKRGGGKLICLFIFLQLWTGFEDSGAHAIFLPKALPVAQIAMTGSIYSTLAITIERYLIVCHPFYTVSHSWKAKRYIVPIGKRGCVIILMNVP